MADCSVLKVERYRKRRSQPCRSFAVTAASVPPSRHITIKETHVRNVWFVMCLFALLAHSFVITTTYMNYETATETVIEMPTKVKPPATSVCIPLWDLVKQSKLSNGSKCFAHLLTNRSRVTDCATELLNSTLVTDILQDRTMDPADMIHTFAIRQPSKNGSTWINKTTARRKDAGAHSTGAEVYEAGYVFSYYKGPYKCIRFGSLPLDSTTLAIDRLTTGYPRSRNFFIGYFKMDRHWTEAMKALRLYVHENGTFPRGEVTLPVVANLSKALSFVITYTRIETHYLPSPYEHNCIDYTTKKHDSRLACVADCVRHLTITQHNTMTWDDLLVKRGAEVQSYRALNRTFVSPYDDYVQDYEFSCSESCERDCITKTFYTTLSETSPHSLEVEGNQIFEVNTRFENPETSVKFVPRLDFQAYVIYIASVFGIWFSASIFHMGVDVALILRSGVKFVNHIH